MYQLRVFGGLRLEGPTGPITGRAAQRKRLAVLARLALARGAPLTRDELCGLIWAGSSEVRARQSLSASLYDLRCVLGKAALSSAGEDVRLDAAFVECDAVVFEIAASAGRVQEAASLWSGPLLDGICMDGADGELWERWVEDERARLTRVYATVLERLADLRSLAGDAAGELDMLLRLVREDPYGARANLRLVQALARAGEGAQAIERARLYAERMQTELGATPDPAVMALEDRLRRQAPTDVDAPAPLPSSATDSTVDASQHDDPAKSAGAAGTPAIAAEDAPKTVPAPAPGSRTALSGAALGVALGTALSLLLMLAGARGLPTRLPSDRFALLAAVLVLLTALALTMAPWALARWAGTRRASRTGLLLRSGARAGFVLGFGAALSGAYALAPRRIAASRGTMYVSGPSPRARPYRVAVAPFQNRTGQASLDALSRMATDWLLRGLMALEGVEVADFWGKASPDGSPGAIRELATWTGADVIVTGSYRLEDKDVLLTAQITDAATATPVRQVGPIRMARQEVVSGVERLRSLVSAAVAIYLNAPQSTLARSAGMPPTLEAYATALTGAQAFNGGDLVGAQERMERAAALDSTFLQPYWLLATLAKDRGECPLVDSLAGIVERRRRYATPSLVFHMSRERALCRRDYESALQAARRLAQAMPASELAQTVLTQATARSGRLRAAAERYARVDQTRPPYNDPWWDLEYVSVLHLLGRYDAELRQADTARRRFPDFGLRFYLDLAGLAALDRTRELELRLDEARHHGPVDWPVPDVYRRIAHELAWHGHEASARRFAAAGLQALDQQSPRQQRSTEAQVIRVLLLMQLRRWDEAHVLARRLQLTGRVQPISFNDINVTDGMILALRGITAAKAGDARSARAILDTLGAIPVTRVQSPASCRELYQAAVQAALGERAAALGLLAQAQARGAISRSEPAAIHWDVMYRDLWHDPELDRMLGRRD